MKPKHKRWLSEYRRLIVDSLILVLCILISAMLAKPAYVAFRQWRTERMAEDAAEALAAGDFVEAKRLAGTVLVINRERHDMLTILQRSMEGLKDPGAVDISRMLMVHPEATEEDHIRGFEDTCASMPIASVTATWMALGEKKAFSPTYLLPFATRWFDQGLNDEDGPRLMNRTDLSLEPELHLQAVRGLMKSTSDPSLSNAQSHIAGLMAVGGDTALPAFRLLAGVPLEEFRDDAFPDLESWIQTQPEATTDDHLLALIQRRYRFPDRLNDLAKQAIDRFAAKDPAAVGRWLNQVGLAEQTLTLLPEEQAAADVGPFLARADALIALERWPDAVKWLASPHQKAEKIEIQSRRMICDGKPDNGTRRSKAWADALLEVGGTGPDPDALLEFSRRMQEAGLKELAAEAMVAAVRTGRGRLPFWHQIRDLLPWLQARQQGQAIAEVCSVMARLQPSNPEVVIEALDMDCILGKSKAATLLKQIEELEKQHPTVREMIRFRELKGTVLLQADQPEAALTACGPDVTGHENPSDRLIAVTAAAKAMLGQNPDAAQLFERVVWKHKLREEKDFFTRFMVKFSPREATEPVDRPMDTDTPQVIDENAEGLELMDLLSPVKGGYRANSGSDMPQPAPEQDPSVYEFKTPPPAEGQ
jgi:hypothetical protein